ncbi:hypothetical protein CspHIS471_0400840 [Cutaneotrichosporon sp. HIS471]|nr:hypothetical protein CspHIS471_0400840 [Cutaneotrichosporon sp. HIS471]
MSLDQCRWRDICHFEGRHSEDCDFNIPYALIGTGTDEPTPLVAAHRRGEMPVGWISLSRARALGTRLAAQAHPDGPAHGVVDPAVEPGMCFHVLSSPAEMSSVMQCGAGAAAPAHATDAPLPAEIPADTPLALSWAATADGLPGGATTIAQRQHGVKAALLGIVPGWPARLATPMAYVHRARARGQAAQGTPRLRELDLAPLEAAARALEADGAEQAVLPPAGGGLGMCVHRIHVGPGGYDAIAAQVKKIRCECMGLKEDV